MQNCKLLTLIDMEPLLSVKRNKQPLCNYHGCNPKKTQKIKEWGMSQVVFKKLKK